VVPVIFLTDLNTVIFFISLAIGFSMSTGACFYAVNVDLAKERAGTALGMMNTFFALSGFLAPSITGLIVSWTLDYNAVFYLLTGLSFTSAMLIFFLHNRSTLTHKTIDQWHG
jgi:nitrate/nitrite transporter NarK